MKQSIAGFLLGLLITAAVFAFAGGQKAADSQIGKYQIVAVPGFGTKEFYTQPSVWKVNTATGETTKVY